MSVGSTHDRSLQESVVTIYTHQCLYDEDYETKCIFRSLARTMEQYASICRKTPVVVFTRTIDTIERLFVKQSTETMLASHLLHEAHQEHVVVNGKVALLKDRSNLKLVRCNFVVASLARNTKFKSTNLKVFHESLHTLRDGAEIVVFHLLVLSRIVTHKGATCKYEVRTC